MRRPSRWWCILLPPPSTSFQGSWRYALDHDLENVILAKAVRAASLPQALVTALKMACDPSLATCGSWDFMVEFSFNYLNSRLSLFCWAWRWEDRRPRAAVWKWRQITGGIRTESRDSKHESPPLAVRDVSPSSRHLSYVKQSSPFFEPVRLGFPAATTQRPET